MKTFGKILGGILILFIIAIIGVNLYFTDARLKATAMPYLNDAVGRDVEVDNMSLTFFSTFPQPGLSIEKLSIPGKTKKDTLLSMDELVASVELFSLMGDQIEVSEISLEHPQFTYVVHPDSTTNIDFLMAGEEAPEDTSSTRSFAINIPSFGVQNANFGYIDSTSQTSATINNLDAQIALRYAELIESTIDLNIGGLSASSGGTNYANKLELSLNEKSTIDLENEEVILKEGTLGIRGLDLNLSGSISNWSKSLNADLSFHSSSDNFGELLRLVPKSYEEYIKGLETEGALAINGTLSGALIGEELPAFDATMSVKDGYIKNPDLPKPVENVQLEASATNELIILKTMEATAGKNKLSASGKLEDPLEEDGNFSLSLDSDVDLSTIDQFYDLSTLDIEDMKGKLAVDGKANGSLSAPEEASFDADVNLNNGSLSYAEVKKPIENINLVANASQKKISIKKMGLNAAGNSFSLKGNISNPLKEKQRAINLTTDLDFELGTIKDFYPIDEDTLKLRGSFTAHAKLKGKAAQIEDAVESGSISLTNGLIDHKMLAKPIRDLTLKSDLNGSKLNISEASFKTGNNSMTASGSVGNYLSDNRTIDLKLNGQADLSQITEYYDLEPTITKLTGNAKLDLRATGSPAKPADMNFNGKLDAQGINMEGESLAKPVKDLNGTLSMSSKSVDLDKLSFNLGSSDIALNGSLKDYMEYLKAEEDRKVTPHLTGSYKSELLNVDELIDWEDTTSSDAPVPIELPDLNTSVTAEINKLIVTDITMKKLQAKASTTPSQINLNSASVQLFDGKVNGSMTWKVPKPTRTHIDFEGSLDGLQAKTFFREYPILGEDSDFYKYISGALSANVTYATDMDEFIMPIMKTSTMQGDMSMANGRLKDHPMQVKLAGLLNSDELKNVDLDDFTSTYRLKDNVFHIKNMRLTSNDIGMNMDGNQNLKSGQIDYHAKIYLPGRFEKAIGSVISNKAVKALKQDDGTIMVPLRISRTSDNPKVRPDKEAIKPIIKKFLKDKAGNALKNILGG